MENLRASGARRISVMCTSLRSIFIGGVEDVCFEPLPSKYGSLAAEFANIISRTEPSRFQMAGAHSQDTAVPVSM